VLDPAPVPLYWANSPTLGPCPSPRMRRADFAPCPALLRGQTISSPFPSSRSDEGPASDSRHRFVRMGGHDVLSHGPDRTDQSLRGQTQSADRIDFPRCCPHLLCVSKDAGSSPL